VQHLGTGNVDKTDENGQSVGQFSNSYNLVGLSYGQKIFQQLSAGVTAKWIQTNLDDARADSFAGDLGLSYGISPAVAVGFAVLNIGQGIKFNDTADPLPTTYKLGVALRPISTLTTVIDGLSSYERRADVRCGIEWSPLQIIALRLGYQTDTQDSNGANGFTAGIGLTVWRQEFSYAFVPFGDLGAANYFSLLLHFGPTQPT